MNYEKTTTTRKREQSKYIEKLFFYNLNHKKEVDKYLLNMCIHSIAEWQYFKRAIVWNVGQPQKPKPTCIDRMVFLHVFYQQW